MVTTRTVIVTSTTTPSSVYVGCSPVYGCSWDGGSSPALTRTDDAVGLVANVGLDMNPVVNDFDSIYPWSDITEVTDGYGNVFIRIPKFYIRKTAIGNARTWQISKDFIAGSYLPHCFDGGKSYIDVGKYNPWVSASKLESKPNIFSGTLPAYSAASYRTFATNNGAGYYLMDIHIYDVLRTMAIVEFATLDVQTLMMGWTTGRLHNDLLTVAESGVNRVIVSNATASYYAVGQPLNCGSSSGGYNTFRNRIIQSINFYDANNQSIVVDGASFNTYVGYYISNSPWKTGFSSSILAKSGSIINNTSGKYPCKYREIENLWGSQMILLDGITLYNLQPYVCSNYQDYVSGKTTSPYEALSHTIYSSSSYIKTMGYDYMHPFIELPIDGGGSSSTYYCDYIETPSSIATDSLLVGGFFNQVGGSGKAGIFYAYVNQEYTWTFGLNQCARLVRSA